MGQDLVARLCLDCFGHWWFCLMAWRRALSLHRLVFHPLFAAMCLSALVRSQLMLRRLLVFPPP